MTRLSVGVERAGVALVLPGYAAGSVGPVDVEAEDLAAVATSGMALVCEGCGEAEAALECGGCLDHLCHDCWGDGDPFCEGCMGEGSDGRPVEDVHVEADFL